MWPCTDFRSIVIAVVLSALIIAANEADYRIGRRRATRYAGEKARSNAIQAAMLGLLAPLLGLSFTMALQRYDSRSQALIDEGGDALPLAG